MKALTISRKARFIFKADKISGFEGNLFFSLIILEVIRKSNERNRYFFPFYGLSLDLKKEKGDEWIREKKYEKVCEKIVADYGKIGKKYFESVKETVVHETAVFHKYALRLINDLSKLKNQDLLDEYTKFCKTYASFYGLGAITFLFEHILSERLAASILSRYKNATEIIENLFSSKYKSFMTKSNELLLKVKKEKNRVRRNKLIEKFQKNFFFMKTNYRAAPILTERAILEMAEKVEKSKKVEAKSFSYLKNIRLTREEKTIVSLLKQAEVIRDQRKQLNITGSYILGRFLDEVVRRSKIPKSIASRAFWFEYEDLIKKPMKIMVRLRKRRAASIILEKNNSYYFDRIVLAERVRLKVVKEIKGTPASRGKVREKAKIVLRSNDFRNFQKGEILVAEMTRPDFLPVVKKAGAIITDEGGLTCHAAIISRELGIPCIVGTKIATRVIKNGQIITVDGDRGIIKI